MSTPAVTLQVGSEIHRGWSGVSIQLSLQRLSGAFSIDATDSWTEAGRVVSRQIRPLDPVIARIGDETVLTGVFDDAAPFYRRGDVGLRLTGRDSTARLVDCSVEKREFVGQTLLQIAQRLCADFGIPVRLVNWSGRRSFGRFTVDAGQTYARAIEDGCRQVGAMMWTDGTGALLIGRPGEGEHVGTLRLGRDILEGDASNSTADRFSSVTVVTQRTGDDLWGNAGGGAAGHAVDSAITLYRPLVISAETQVEGAATPSERAAWEVAVRRARASATTLLVQGWTGPSGALYRPGRRLDIEDGRLGRSGTLTIADVDLTRNRDGGSTARLKLMPKDAFTVLPEGQPVQKGKEW